MKKIARHPNWSVSHPPRDGPRARPRDVIEAWSPSACPSRNGCTLPIRMAGEFETRMAAPIPWRTRAAISISTDVDIPHRTEAGRKTPNPAR
jgi:hypothetical protein